MKRYYWLNLIFALIFIVSGIELLSAQESSTRLVSGYVNLNDSANVYQALYDNTPIEPEFKLAPKFAIVGADNRFVFSVGASMKFTSSFDFGNPVRNPQGMGPSDIQKPLTSDTHLYQMSAGGSGIFFNIIGFPNTANEIGLFISVGLDTDSNNTYRLGAGQIYMRYHDFQCGYANSLYNDRKADAYTIDSHGPCASGGYTTVGMNWQHYFNRHIRMGLGVEMPKASYTQIVPGDLSMIEGIVAYAETSHQYMPNFPFYIGYGWKNGHVRLSGILRDIHYINLMSGNGHDVLGYGLKLTGNANVGIANLFWMGQIGWASASCFHDSADAGLDLVPDDVNPGQLKATHSCGFITGAQFNINPKFFITAQCSYLRNFIPHYGAAATTHFDDQMRRGYTAITNAVWKISPLFSTGVEYRYARRHNEDGLSLGNNRIYAMLLMNF